MQYQWIYGTHTYELSDSAPFEVVSIDGIDIASVSPVTEQGPLQHGDTDVDMRLDPRIIQMVLQARTTAVYDHETNRATFNRIFTPSTQLGKLRITYNNASVYEIVARCLGNTGVRRSLVDDQLLKAGIAFRCPDPLWYNPEMHSLSFGIAAGNSAFSVPTPVPTPMGSSVLNQTTTINYAGTFAEFPLFLVYGPIVDPKIVNSATGKKIDLTGITIASGSYYTIDLRYGRKFAYKNGDTTDLRTGEVTTDSQLATFAIEADPTVADGINPITITGTSANSVTQVYMQYYDRYSGI